MKNKILASLIFICTLNLLGQSLVEFKNDFQLALDEKFSEKKLNEMFRNHSSFFTPHSVLTQSVDNLKGKPTTVFPLANFKKEKIYTDNIDRLINSTNPNHRILAYLAIAGTGDTSLEPQLLLKLSEEKGKGCLIWAGMALMYLNTNHTTELFDFLVENEDFGDSHMIPLFFKLNNDSLQQTAYSRINSANLKAKVLAVQTLSVTKLNSKTEKLLRAAVDEWDFAIKGYAVYSIKELQIGNLLESFKPLLDSQQTRIIALQALANSPTETDRQYLFDLVARQDTVPGELLDCFYLSKNIDNLRYWLKLLYSKPIQKHYVFFVFQQPLIVNDSLLFELHLALKKITNVEVLSELVRALANRKDENSIDIAVSLLSHTNETIRYWAASSLEDIHSPLLKVKIPNLLSDPKLRVTSLTALAIKNRMDTLQSIFDKILLEETGRDWTRSAIEYLSEFPQNRHKILFKEVLQKQDDEFTNKRCAALGLARLRDTNSVELIISACRLESKRSDMNTLTYLHALGMLKGRKAKSEIEKYKNSNEEVVRKLVTTLLNQW